MVKCTAAGTGHCGRKVVMGVAKGKPLTEEALEGIQNIIKKGDTLTAEGKRIGVSQKRLRVHAEMIERLREIERDWRFRVKGRQGFI